MHRLWRFVMRKRRLKSSHIPYLLIAVLGVGLLASILWAELRTPAEQISLTALVHNADDGLIKSASLAEDRIAVVYRDGREAEFRGHLPDETLVKLVGAGVDVSFAGTRFIDVLSKHGYPLLMLLPILLIAWHILGGAGRLTIGGPTKLLDPTAAQFRFSDVAGQEEAKDQMTEIVDFLRDPKSFTRLGAKAPKGALMVGPPGVGKTLLARAVAGETKSGFIAVSGADFRQTFMGLGANKVRTMFRLARKNAPCLIFIDEIETLARSCAPA